MTERVIRVAAVGDLHCRRDSQGGLQPLFTRMAEAEVIVLCGDLTDNGLPDEARVLARELTAAVKAPVVGVLGNHDYEAGHAAEVAAILTDAGVRLLDGEGVEIAGVGFAGVKGFAGGFGRHALQAWGEGVLKQFVREAVEEALKLETALARLRAPRRVAVLHYAPIRATVEGEPAEIHPFLGSSRLEEPINRYETAAVVHGHAHHGRPSGQTAAGVPVYNVSLPLLARALPGQPPYRLLEIALPHDSPAPVELAP